MADNNVADYSEHADPALHEDTTLAAASASDGHAETTAGVDDDLGDFDDPELEALKQRMLEMEKEAQKLRELQEKITKEGEQNGDLSGANADDVDSRSIYVGNVDYVSTPEELQEHFKGSGTVNRVTILCDKFTGHPKGYAYIEFASTEAVTNAQLLDGSMLHGRPLKVIIAHA
ncbi:RNA-binding domain-containing protein [Martensiomyces pterosporus]|nr:RNA-binding domain-containing protein [Martensiomyces pterosporus]